MFLTAFMYICYIS